MKNLSFGGAILDCSALKESYRELLSRNNKVTLIFLDESYDLVYARLSARKDHFFSKNILRSQFGILERPSHCISLSINQPVNNICEIIIDELKI
jgi:gluconokinase